MCIHPVVVTGLGRAQRIAQTKLDKRLLSAHRWASVNHTFSTSIHIDFFPLFSWINELSRVNAYSRMRSLNIMISISFWSFKKLLRLCTMCIPYFREYFLLKLFFFQKWRTCKFSYTFRIMAIFYFINWVVAAENIEGGKPLKGGNYSWKYST